MIYSCLNKALPHQEIMDVQNQDAVIVSISRLKSTDDDDLLETVFYQFQ